VFSSIQLSDYDPFRFTLTPQRMRMIVEAFKETLELGLSKPGQVVVRIYIICLSLARSFGNICFYILFDKNQDANGDQSLTHPCIFLSKCRRTDSDRAYAAACNLLAQLSAPEIVPVTLYAYAMHSAYTQSLTLTCSWTAYDPHLCLWLAHW
jgi:hypothetical protein